MLDGFSLGIARDAAAPPIVNSTVHRACHRQIPDGAVFYAAEQTGALEIAGYAQIFDGMSLPVKGAGIGAVPVRTDGRPILVIQVDIVHQNGADASVSAVDEIAEQLQIVCIGEQIGVFCSAIAVRGKHRRGQQGQHHTKQKQGAEQSFLHGHSSLSFLWIPQGGVPCF